MKLADRYALISQEIEQLEVERKKLRAELLALKSDEIAGDHATVFVGSRKTLKLDPKKVYDAVKPSRFFQLVSIKVKEAKDAMPADEFEKAIIGTTETDVVTYDVKIAAIVE